MKINCYIYSLSDEKGEVRYVGATVNAKVRLRGHICESIRIIENRHIHPPTEKQLWVADILRSGKEPLMTILEECDSLDAADREIHHYLENNKEGRLLCCDPRSQSGRYKNGNSLLVHAEIRAKEALKRANKKKMRVWSMSDIKEDNPATITPEEAARQGIKPYTL